MDEFDAGTIADTDDAANFVYENAADGTAVGISALARDADATDNLVTYSLADDAGGRFTIDGSTGVVTVKDGTRLDYEFATSYSMVVRAASSDGSASLGSLTVTIGDILEPPASSERELLNNPDESASDSSSDSATDDDGSTGDEERDEKAEEAEEADEETQESTESTKDQKRPFGGTKEKSASVGTDELSAQSDAETPDGTSTEVAVGVFADTLSGRSHSSMRSTNARFARDAFSVDTWYVQDTFMNEEVGTQASSVGGFSAPQWGLCWEAIAEPEKEVRQGHSVEIVVGTAGVVTTAASLTYAFWSIRGASLAASMVSTLPAWSMVDPLPIADSDARTSAAGSKNRDDESLEEIASRGATNDKKNQE